MNVIYLHASKNFPGLNQIPDLTFNFFSSKWHYLKRNKKTGTANEDQTNEVRRTDSNLSLVDYPNIFLPIFANDEIKK